MRLIIVLNHPAHYHLFKNLRKILVDDGHNAIFLINNKDVLEQLLVEDRVDYVKILDQRPRKKNKFSVIANGVTDLLKKDLFLFRFARQWKPNLMLGTDISVTHIGKLLSIPSLFFNEDDYEINKEACILSYPMVTNIVAPNICSVGKYNDKKIGYFGYQKLAYLHPNHFKPDFTLISNIVKKDEVYFIIRLVSLTAGHDVVGAYNGLDEKLVDEVINTLSTKGRVFISSEKPISSKYEKYRLLIKSNLMHHLLSYSSLLVTDSQSMCIEAALLGTPFIRFNDFVGKIRCLNEIENKYKLGFGIPTCDYQKLLPTINQILAIPDLKNIWGKRRDILLADKIDVTAFYVWLVENYPNSVEIMRNNPDYQLKFQ